MNDDPIVAEVRRIRDEHAAKFGYDLKAIYDDIKRLEAESGMKYISFPPQRVKGRDAAGEIAATQAGSGASQ